MVSAGGGSAALTRYRKVRRSPSLLLAALISQSREMKVLQSCSAPIVGRMLFLPLLFLLGNLARAALRCCRTLRARAAAVAFLTQSAFGSNFSVKEVFVRSIDELHMRAHTRSKDRELLEHHVAFRTDPHGGAPRRQHVRPQLLRLREYRMRAPSARARSARSLARALRDVRRIAPFPHAPSPPRPAPPCSRLGIGFRRASRMF